MLEIMTFSELEPYEPDDSQEVAHRGVSGPWGPQFCGALCYGETQRLPAGGAGSPPVGSEAGARTQTHFGNNIGPIENWLKIKYIGRCLHP